VKVRESSLAGNHGSTPEGAIPARDRHGDFEGGDLGPGEGCVGQEEGEASGAAKAINSESWRNRQNGGRSRRLQMRFEARRKDKAYQVATISRQEEEGKSKGLSCLHVGRREARSPVRSGKLFWEEDVMGLLGGTTERVPRYANREEKRAGLA